MSSSKILQGHASLRSRRKTLVGVRGRTPTSTFGVLLLTFQNLQGHARHTRRPDGTETSDRVTLSPASTSLRVRESLLLCTTCMDET